MVWTHLLPVRSALAGREPSEELVGLSLPSVPLGVAFASIDSVGNESQRPTGVSADRRGWRRPGTPACQPIRPPQAALESVVQRSASCGPARLLGRQQQGAAEAASARVFGRTWITG